jgi:GNAT superfamily N-acetyltransferase
MNLQVRKMLPADRAAVAELICCSTNWWYQTHARPAIFSSEQNADVFFDTYERLDPGCGLVVENPDTGRLIGSCFTHPRPTHVSLGIMNAHPNHAGKGVARLLLQHITSAADAAGKPVRLVSSAVNLDSFSLYNRSGFVPRMVFQDMFLSVPVTGLPHRVPGMDRVRDATRNDLAEIGALDQRLLGLRRDADYALFMHNQQGFWRLSVAVDAAGQLTGWMASSAHPGCNMIGPGLAVDEETALALLAFQLNQHPSRTPVFLVPATASRMTATLYSWGAKNCELHFQQVRGALAEVKGITMPTFLPESA